MNFRVLLKFDNHIRNMDYMCVGRVILIWMLLSVTLGNSLFCTVRARDLLFQNLSPSMFGVQSILCTLLKKKKKHCSWLFWVEPKQRTHWEMVEAIVWHTNLRWIKFEYKLNLKSMEFEFHSVYFNSSQVLENVIQYHNTLVALA